MSRHFVATQIVPDFALAECHADVEAERLIDSARSVAKGQVGEALVDMLLKDGPLTCEAEMQSGYDLVLQATLVACRLNAEPPAASRVVYRVLREPPKPSLWRRIVDSLTQEIEYDGPRG